MLEIATFSSLRKTPMLSDQCCTSEIVKVADHHFFLWIAAWSSNRVKFFLTFRIAQPTGPTFNLFLFINANIVDLSETNTYVNTFAGSSLPLTPTKRFSFPFL